MAQQGVRPVGEQLFEAFDRNGDGRISRAEFDEGMARFDLNRDGVISAAEFEQGMAAMRTPPPRSAPTTGLHTAPLPLVQPIAAPMPLILPCSPTPPGTAAMPATVLPPGTLIQPHLWGGVATAPARMASPAPATPPAEEELQTDDDRRDHEEPTDADGAVHDLARGLEDCGHALQMLQANSELQQEQLTKLSDSADRLRRSEEALEDLAGRLRKIEAENEGLREQLGRVNATVDKQYALVERQYGSIEQHFGLLQIAHERRLGETASLELQAASEVKSSVMESVRALLEKDRQEARSGEVLVGQLQELETRLLGEMERRFQDLCLKDARPPACGHDEAELVALRRRLETVERTLCVSGHAGRELGHAGEAIPLGLPVGPPPALSSSGRPAGPCVSAPELVARPGGFPVQPRGAGDRGHLLVEDMEPGTLSGLWASVPSFKDFLVTPEDLWKLELDRGQGLGGQSEAPEVAPVHFMPAPWRTAAASPPSRRHPGRGASAPPRRSG